MKFPKKPLLLNQTTVPNAYVRLAPVISELAMIPDPNNFTNGSLRWDDNLIIHENRHMQQFSNFNHGFTKALGRNRLSAQGEGLHRGRKIPMKPATPNHALQRLI